MIIKVTRQHIDAAVENYRAHFAKQTWAKSCPIARAISEQFPAGTAVSTDGHTATCWDTNQTRPRDRKFQLSTEAAVFVSRLDRTLDNSRHGIAGFLPGPFEFVMEPVV